MKYLYYPGCSLKGTGRHYEDSLLPVFDALKMSYRELDDWNCCGATAYMAVDELKAFAMAARNLALAEEQGKALDKLPAQLIAPCAACYLVLYKAQRYMQEHPAEIGEKIVTALRAAKLDYTGRVTLRHPLDVFVNDVGLDTIAATAKRPLKGLRVACYYGCQVVRPYSTFDDQYHPMTMDRIMEALGAEVVDWPLKTRCCGGTMTGTISEVGLRLNYILLREARRHGADVVATACPLCQFNLECYQGQLSKQNHDKINLPVAFFTQLMGLAFGLTKKELGFDRLFVPMKYTPATAEGGRHVTV